MKLLRGNAAKFEAEFTDWDDATLMTDPEIVKFIVYDLKWNKVEEIILGAENRLSEGTFFCFYTPTKSGSFYYEWYADISGLPSLYRGEFEARDIIR